MVGALDILMRGSQDSDAVLARLDDAWFSSTREFVPLLVALDELAPARPSERWSLVRSMLVKRFSEEPNRGQPPPTLFGVKRVKLAGGDFYLGGGNAADDGDGGAGRAVSVAPFYLQQNEVTNAEYRQFDPLHEPGAPDDHPVTNVTWYDAMAYAAWLGGSLPTEAQWEFAARGGEGRRFPWGDQAPTPSRANYRDEDRSGSGRGTLPVGSFPEGATADGIFDLAGNVWEWCRDGADPASTAELDPAAGDAAAASTRVLKGGSYFNDERYLSAAGRNFLHPDARESVVGFRVAWPAARP